MQTFVIVASALGLVVVGALAAWVFLNAQKKQQTDAGQNQALDELKKSMNAMQVQVMEHLASQLNAMRGSFENSSLARNKEAQTFTEGLTEVRELLKQVHTRVQNVETTQEIFKSPKLRGEWGEESLEHLLSQYYDKKLYDLQYMFQSGERADAVFKLPDGKMIAIDSKFPLDNFVKLSKASNEQERESAARLFVQDVKKCIDDIAAKYILPSESTLDFAMMYVPAEAIYYEIVNPAGNLTKDDIATYAWNKRIVLTSPNQLYLHLRSIEHWFKDLEISRQTAEIRKRFEQVSKDGEKLLDSFRKLGKHINDAQGAYESSEKRLGLLVTKVDRLTKADLREELPEPENNHLDL